MTLLVAGRQTAEWWSVVTCYVVIEWPNVLFWHVAFRWSYACPLAWWYTTRTELYKKNVLRPRHCSPASTLTLCIRFHSLFISHWFLGVSNCKRPNVIRSMSKPTIYNRAVRSKLSSNCLTLCLYVAILRICHIYDRDVLNWVNPIDLLITFFSLHFKCFNNWVL